MERSYNFLAYGGDVTFFRSKRTNDLKDIDLAIMGVPFDNGVSNRSGTRFGPRSIRELSLLVGSFHYPWDEEITEKYHIIDYGDVGYSVKSDPIRYMMEETYKHAKRILDSGAKLLTIGGDHTIPYGMVRAASEKYGKLALLHFDSHGDSSPGFSDEKVYHGTFAYDLQEEGYVDMKKSAQVYIRTSMYDCGYNIIYANEAFELGPEALAAKIKDIVGDMPVYLTFDIDSLDPAFAPGTGTPVIGGPSTREARATLRHLQGLNIVAADLVEVNPIYDPTEATSLAAATIAKDLLYLLLEK